MGALKALFSFSLILLLNSCQNEEAPKISTIIIKHSNFEITIPALGELKAKTSTPVKIPSEIRRSQILAWLAPENIFVHEGDVLARFDPTTYQARSQDELVKIKTLNLEVEEKDRDLDKDRLVLEGKSFILAREKTMAQKYGATDLDIYSKSDIIDAAIDLNFLESKDDYFLWKKNKFEKHADAEMGLLEMKRTGHQTQYDQFQDALRILEIRAPHDGIFVYEKNWRGESLRIGQNVWPGMKIGKLPDINSLEAMVYVLESEASGLKEGLDAEISLDAHPGYAFTGKINMVAPLAKPKERRSPIKYFDVNIKLDTLDLKQMRLGNQLKAKIIVKKKEEAVAIPNQAVFQEEQVNWVYVASGNKFEKRLVTVGDRSLTRTEITSGLQQGEEIALSQPTMEDIK